MAAGFIDEVETGAKEGEGDYFGTKDDGVEGQSGDKAGC